MNPARVLRLSRIIRTASDLAQSVDFYCQALGFTVLHKTQLDGDGLAELVGIKGICGQSVKLILVNQILELIAFQPQGKPYPVDSDSTDSWFQHIAIVVSDIGAAYKRLSEYSFTSISLLGPQRLPANTGSVTAFKFRDPDGHPIELIHFISGTGDPIWQHLPGLFLGIDHSAIDIAHMKQSIDFYSRLLGFRIASTTTNCGIAQERLDHVPDVLVDVVALNPALESTPHLELLNYRHRHESLIVNNININDLSADCVVLEVEKLPFLLLMFDDENIDYISEDYVSVLAGPGVAALIHDPSGHLLLLIAANE